MKRVSKTIAVLLSVLLIANLIPYPLSVVAAGDSNYITVENKDPKATKKEVKGITVTSPSITKGKLTIYRGTKDVSVQINTKILVSGKGITASTPKYSEVTFYSGNTRVVSVSASGKLTAKKNGYATITITSKADKRKKTSFKVYVKAGVGDLTALINGKTSASFYVGDKATIQSKVDKVAKGADKTLLYTSSNKKVVTVDSKGRIVAVAPGTAYIKVSPKYSTGVSKSIQIVVKPIAPSSIITNSKLNITLGTSKQIQYSVVPKDVKDKRVTFSSSNKTIVSVDSKGMLVGHKVGTARITITSVANTKVKAYVDVTVSQPVVNPTKISAKDISLLKVGAKAQISYAVLPTNATNKSVTFTSLTPSIATVDSKGVVTGVRRGDAIIKITSVANNKISTQVKVHVEDCSTKISWANITDKSVVFNSTITISNPKELVAKLESIIKSNIYLITSAGLVLQPEYRYSMKLDDVTYTAVYVTKDKKLSIYKDGVNITANLSTSNRIIHKVTITAPNGQTIAQAMKQYLEKIEKITQLANLTMDVKIQIGTYSITKVTVQGSYIKIVVNGKEYRFFAEKGELHIVGSIDEVKKIDFIQKLVERGYITLSE